LKKGQYNLLLKSAWRGKRRSDSPHSRSLGE